MRPSVIEVVGWQILPTFGYAIALFVYVCSAGFGLGTCGLLAFASTCRSAARRIAGGVLRSIPGVGLFQLLSAPIALFLGSLFGGSTD